MDKLYIWYYTLARLPKGVSDSGEDFSLFDLNDKNNRGWTGLQYIPDEMLMIYEKRGALSFDWVMYKDSIMIVSEEFLSFIEKHWEKDFYKTSKLTVKNKKEEKCTTKNYYVLFVLKNDNELFVVNEEGKKRASGLQGYFLYPNLTVKNLGKKLYYYDELCYHQALIFTEEVKEIIKKNFYKPEIYLLSDFPKVYNNRFRESELPDIQ